MKQYFVINNLQTDSIDELCGASFGNTNAYALSNQWGCIFWIESNIHGEDVLCMETKEGSPCYLTLNVAGTPYTAYGKPFIPVQVEPNYGIFGPHPTVIFKPGPKK